MQPSAVAARLHRRPGISNPSLDHSMKKQAKTAWIAVVAVFLCASSVDLFYRKLIADSDELGMVKAQIHRHAQVKQAVGATVQRVELRKEWSQYHLDLQGKSGRFHLWIKGSEREAHVLVTWHRGVPDSDVTIEKVEVL